MHVHAMVGLYHTALNIPKQGYVGIDREQFEQGGKNQHNACSWHDE